MIITKTLTLDGKEFIYTKSDKYYIQRDGVEYAEAYDPAEFGRAYIETERELETTEFTV